MEKPHVKMFLCLGRYSRIYHGQSTFKCHIKITIINVLIHFYFADPNGFGSGWIHAAWLAGNWERALRTLSDQDVQEDRIADCQRVEGGKLGLSNRNAFEANCNCHVNVIAYLPFALHECVCHCAHLDSWLNEQLTLKFSSSFLLDRRHRPGRW